MRERIPYTVLTADKRAVSSICWRDAVFCVCLILREQSLSREL